MSDRSARLQDEIKQRKPFRTIRQEALLGLLRTVDLLNRRVAQALQPYDITPQQYNVLRILRGAEPNGLPTLQIAERMVEQAPGITRLLDRLEVKGLVARLRETKDRRQVTCTITAGGLDLLSRLDEPIDQLDDQLLQALDDAEVARLIETCERLRAGLNA